MKRIILKEKTGFETRLPFTIFDERKITFYADSFTNKIEKNETLKFNLPKGVYFYNGSFTKLPKPVEYPSIELPPKERNFDAKRYKIKFGVNPNKCTVNHLLNTITYDNAFRKAPEYILADIFFHELGHRFYSTEKFADLYATKRMLELGYNPSQIGRSAIISLRSESLERKIAKVESLKFIQNG